MDKYPFFNRDISWLSFNHRVLQEAMDLGLPVYDRLKFLAIYSSNLDEFYKVRIASYRGMMHLPEEDLALLDFSPRKVIKTVNKIVHSQQEEYGTTFRQRIIPELEKNNIHLLNGGNCTALQKDYLSSFFLHEVVMHLQPILLSGADVMPFLQDNKIYLALKMFKKSKGDLQDGRKRRPKYAIVRIPSDILPRFIDLPDEDDRYDIILLDDVIRLHVNSLFPGYHVDSMFSIKLSRDADLHIEDEFSGDLIEKIEKSLIRRSTGAPARFLYDSEMPAALLRVLQKALRLNREDLVPGGRYHNFSDLHNFPNPLFPKLEEARVQPLQVEFSKKFGSIFKAIRKKDRIMHFPYQSYDNVISFFNASAIDPKVKEIKLTQYRVADDSAIISALIAAARKGKKVSVFVEVKARFDEEANIRWAREMKDAGIRIIYSIPGLKVHAKTALVLRMSKNEMEGYAFLSTGNFNEKTARIYADHGLLTARKEITEELKTLFEFLEKREAKQAFNNLLIPGFNMIEEIIARIDREIRLSSEGKRGRIILKMNGIQHKGMISKLYQASESGVEIDLIVRGICCLVPGKPFSRNITVSRIVDKYLEHARIWVFGNDGNEEVFMASADWLNRNLKRRIEVGFPIYDPEIKQEVLDILEIQLKDNVKATLLDSELKNIRKENSIGLAVRAQEEIYRYLAAKGG